MKALSKQEAKVGIWMIDAPEPEPGHNDVLIKIKKTAICGTDIHIYNWDEWAQSVIKVPMITGHEFVGEVLEVGSEVTQFKAGDRVSGEGHITCGFCRNCRAGRRHLCRHTEGTGVNRQGCFSEYFVMKAENVYKVPEAISDDVASIFDPLGNAVHTALSFDLAGEDVLITGAGPIGIMAVAICRHLGARRVVITDVNEYRLKMAKDFGADAAVNVAKEDLVDIMKQLKIVEGFDVGLEVSGNGQAWNQMLKTMNHGGKIALLGFPPSDTQIDWTDIVFKGLFVKGIYGREMFETWYKMCAMLQSGLNIDKVITHHYPVDEYQKAFEMMRTGKSGKVILEWS